MHSDNTLAQRNMVVMKIVLKNTDKQRERKQLEILEILEIIVREIFRKVSFSTLGKLLQKNKKFLNIFN